MNETLFLVSCLKIYNTELHVGCILNSLSSFRNTVPHVRCFTFLTNRPVLLFTAKYFFYFFSLYKVNSCTYNDIPYDFLLSEIE